MTKYTLLLIIVVVNNNIDLLQFRGAPKWFVIFWAVYTSLLVFDNEGDRAYGGVYWLTKFTLLIVLQLFWFLVVEHEMLFGNNNNQSQQPVIEQVRLRLYVCVNKTHLIIIHSNKRRRSRRNSQPNHSKLSSHHRKWNQCRKKQRRRLWLRVSDKWWCQQKRSLKKDGRTHGRISNSTEAMCIECAME